MKIAIMGFGVVGSGVAEVVKNGGASMEAKAGEKIEIKNILDLRDFPDSEFAPFMTKDFSDILNDDEVGIVVEVMGGVEPAYTYSKQLLLAGKHVVTSNKELVAKHGTELLSIAQERNLNYMFEASVGGGIPIIRPLNSCLAANELSFAMGILNGTTNYILTRMIRDNQTFDEALVGAQEKGYAERDPSADVEGKDTCRKIAILASLAFGKFADSDKIETEGITKITLEDVEYAEKIGRVIKLVGMSEKVGDKVFAKVCPVMLDSAHPLYGIEDVFNGILVKGDAIGDVMFYGRGAGKLPTASAVVADVIDIVKHKDTNTRLMWKESEPDYLVSEAECPDITAQRYIRLSIDNYEEVSSEIANIFGGCDIIRLDGEGYAKEMAVITRKMNGLEYAKCMEDLKKQDNISVLGEIRLVES